LARKILLADDSVTAQNMGRKILADAGYEVITVNNGSAALKRIGEQRPDVIVLDVYMPGYSGLEVCQRLKETGDTSRIPILLTVGKLEPFKPEEAKRVRADGFIVKPFEASELLSALTRLEDKIVPRNEPSKAGRFARLAKEEGRFDKTMAVEEDSGWKNRIAFPLKKKEKGQEPEPEPPIASPSQRDVRPPTEPVHFGLQSSQAPEEKLDLGALATAGLPKDVTPEEIAALAAAAARMKGKFAEEQPETPPSEMAVVAPPAFSSREEDVPLPPVPETPNLPPASAGLQDISNPETRAVDEIEKPEPAIAKVDEESDLEPVTAASCPSSPERTESIVEPVTMAVAAAVGESTSPASRWTAVSVALEADDTAISLEQEMQRAYAAFAAAETGHASSIESEPFSTPSASVTEASVPVPAIVAPEAAQTLTVVASAATEAVSAAVHELERVASSYVSEKADAAATAAEPEILTAVRDIPKVEGPAEVTLAVANEHLSSDSGPVSESRLPEAMQVTSEEVPQVRAATPHSAAETQVAAGIPNPPASPEALTSHESPMSSGQAIAEATAAMAAAVGGRPVDETSSDADPAIASIVDSVLANLRPKIVEEISRKLGKK
jgi:CheY-like chemotaxis protein